MNKLIKIFELSYEDPKEYTKLPIDTERFTLVEDSENPDYVIVVISHIVYSLELQRKLKKYIRQEKILIFFGDEAISPDLSIFDYALTYDDHLVCADRVMRHPTSFFFRKYWFADEYAYRFQGNEMTHNWAEEYVNRKFCCFIYSDGRAHPFRDELFYILSNYRRVDSLGRHLNNVMVDNSRDLKDWFFDSVNKKSKYRFSIAAENSNLHGYVSEKILSGFFSSSVPVYFGSDAIINEFNPEAFLFINCKMSPEEIISPVEEVDISVEKWIHMVCQPICTAKQIKMHKLANSKWEEFINHIFEQEFDDAKRAPIGTASKEYFNYYIAERTRT